MNSQCLHENDAINPLADLQPKKKKKNPLVDPLAKPNLSELVSITQFSLQFNLGPLQ